MFDPDKIRCIASELCNTHFNDFVAIIIPGVQYNVRNAPYYRKLIVLLLKLHVYVNMLSSQTISTINILATHVAVGYGE